jgi:hypothetical protein
MESAWASEGASAKLAAQRNLLKTGQVMAVPGFTPNPLSARKRATQARGPLQFLLTVASGGFAARGRDWDVTAMNQYPLPLNSRYS